MYTLNEASAYDKFRPAQGSGFYVYATLWNGFIWSSRGVYSTPRMATSTLVWRSSGALIQSCRHAARVPRCIRCQSTRLASQTNAPVQLNPSNHIVLIDFASTTQTWQLDELNFIQNYFGTRRVLNSNGWKFGWVWQRSGLWNISHRVISRLWKREICSRISWRSGP